MKTEKIHFVIILISIYLNFTNSQNISTLGISICEIIDKFYSKHSQNVDIISFGRSQGKLVSKIMENLDNSMTVTVKKQNLVKKLEGQSILLFNNFWHFVNFNSMDSVDFRYINPVRFLVYCKNATTLMLSMLKTDLVIPPFYYFIIFDNNDDKLKLYTFENRNDIELCHESQQLIKINEFSSTTLKWTKNPIFPKKYKNFHGCKMIIGVYGYSNFLKYYSYEDRKVLVSGLLPDMMQIISDQLNFSVFYTLCYNVLCTKRLHGNLDVYNIAIIPTLEGYAMNNRGDYRWNNEMLNIQCM